MPSSFKPLSDQQIEAKLSQYIHNFHVILYKNLKHLESLLDIMPCVLLYQTHGGSLIGHFVCLFVNKEGIQYFDSTGRVPDELLEESFDDPIGRVASGCDFTYLRALLLEASEDLERPVIYNEHKLQAEGTASCGGWCAMRLIAGDLSNEEFAELFKGMKPEQREHKVTEFYKRL